MITILDEMFIQNEVFPILDSFTTLWKLTHPELNLSFELSSKKEYLIFLMINTTRDDIKRRSCLNVSIYDRNSINIFISEWKIKENFNVQEHMENYFLMKKAVYSIGSAPGLRSFEVKLNSIEELKQFLIDFDKAL